MLEPSRKQGSPAASLAKAGLHGSGVNAPDPGGFVKGVRMASGFTRLLPGATGAAQTPGVPASPAGRTTSLRQRVLGSKRIGISRSLASNRGTSGAGAAESRPGS